MILKNKDILTRVNILNRYCTKRFPQRISYAITRNIMIFSDEIESYNKQLKKILDSYKEYYVKDDKGEPQIDKASGLPVIMPEHSNDFMQEVMELLEIEIDVKPYFINESLFDYDDEKYDTMSAIDIINLQSVLCDKSAETKED
jgi:hypothetical protein